MQSLFQQIGLERNRFSYGRSTRRLFYFIVKNCKRVKLNSRKAARPVAGELRGNGVGLLSLPLPSGVFAYLLAKRFGFLRVFLAFDFQIELC